MIFSHLPRPLVFSCSHTRAAVGVTERVALDGSTVLTADLESFARPLRDLRRHLCFPRSPPRLKQPHCSAGTVVPQIADDQPGGLQLHPGLRQRRGQP